MPDIRRRAGGAIAKVMGVLILAALSCRPVITIGWGELLLLGLIAALILGPVLLRLLNRFRGNEKGEIGED